MTVVTRELELLHDGNIYRPLLAWDDAETTPRPAVLVAHTIQGRGEFVAGRATALAHMGYAALAVDVYGGGFFTTDHDEGRGKMVPLLQNRPELQARLHAHVEIAKALPEADENRIAAIGYCFGGLCTLDIARTRDDVLGVASLHGNLTPPGNTDDRKISASILIMHGDADPLVPPEQVDTAREELTRAGADWQIHIYGHTLHAFTAPGTDVPERGLKYNEAAARRSWKSLQDFLTEILDRSNSD